MHVSSSVFAAFIFAAIAEIAVPILLLVILGMKKRINPKPLFFGFGAFFVSQLCLRIPILQVLGTQSWFKEFALNTIPYLVVLSFTAGLFEESARYLCAGCFLKKNRSFRDAVSFGLGHGFCEVILLTGMAQINNITYSIMINNGTLEKAVPAAVASQVIAAMQSATAAVVYLGVLERVSAVLFHIFASVLIFKGVNDRKPVYYLLAILAHTVFNIAGVALTKYVNMWVGEAVMLILALAALLLVFKMKPTFPSAEQKVPVQQQEV